MQQNLKKFKKKNGSKGSGKRPSHFLMEVGENLVDEKRNLTIIDRFIKKKQCKSDACCSGYTNRSKKIYIVKCNKCGITYESIQENLIFRKDNCPCCSNKRVFVGYNDLATIRPDLVVYFKDKSDATKYTIKSNKIVSLICPVCHTEKSQRIYTLSTHGFSCKECSDNISYPNKFSYVLLKQLPIQNVIHEFIIPEDGKYRYDNYFEFNGNKYLLEMDGPQHKHAVSIFSSTNNDEIKDALAEKYGYILIRIDATYSDMDFIKNSFLCSKFNELFNLSRIDWSQCDKFASGSMLVEVVHYFDDLEMNVGEISNELNIPESTIKKYLRKANELKLLKTDTNKFKNCKAHSKINGETYNDVLKNVFDYKAKWPNADYIDIASYYNYDVYKLIELLDYAIENNIIKYDLGEEKEKRKQNSFNNLRHNDKKKIYVYSKDYKLFGIYESGIDAVKSKDNIYEWTVKGIQKVCTGHQKSHRNFIFSYFPIEHKSVA